MTSNATKSIVALTLAALMLAVAPAAVGGRGSSGLAPDDRPGLHGPSGIAEVPGVGTARYLAPDDRPGLHRPGAIDATAGAFDEGPSPAYVQIAASGFDWGSAGIGAGAGAGAILALIGGVLFLRSTRMGTPAT